jgi:hypothetical protein
MKPTDFFTKMTLMRHTLREVLSPAEWLKALHSGGESTYGDIVRSVHHTRGVLVQYRFKAGNRQYKGWSHYTGSAFRNALKVGNHIKIVYVKGRPRLSRWVEDDRVAATVPESIRGRPTEKNRGTFEDWVNHFRQD